MAYSGSVRIALETTPRVTDLEISTVLEDTTVLGPINRIGPNYGLESVKKIGDYIRNGTRPARQ